MHINSLHYILKSHGFIHSKCRGPNCKEGYYIVREGDVAKIGYQSDRTAKVTESLLRARAILKDCGFEIVDEGHTFSFGVKIGR